MSIIRSHGRASDAILDPHLLLAIFLLLDALVLKGPVDEVILLGVFDQTKSTVVGD